ncbi:sigma-54 interaction domain-containing protein [Metaclostridioides mangenotii]|uniref:sigma-54 interaction domain-containing protein n=1 Tax=Metaclostridioides mangenotii TaxID=1540 RepID=UPI0028E62CDE|nr:sigma 54-interacting transcriptional regulator [Clostridioides mangenotii]
MIHMIELGYIKEDIQNIAYAIESVLNIDVTIVNSDLVRIAGTGIYLDKIGERVNEYSAFKKSYTDQSIIFIDDPQSSEICKECCGNENCMEFAEVCCPIVYEDKSYGVIGLIAFTEDQAHVIKDKENDLINFLGKMADLISSKLKAHIKTYELDLEKKKLETLFDNMDKAVVSIDVNGKIDKYNSKFMQVFNLKGEMAGKNIFLELEFINRPSIENFNKNKSCSFFYRRNGHDSKGLYNMNKIELQGKLKGYVIDFIDKKDAIKNYNKMNKDYRIKLENIIGNSRAIMKSKEEASMASKSASTVLITGESGTGKELFARAIHNHSNRVDNPFITVNCAAIPDNLLESELFGYEEGAFTGAKKGGKIGTFELAHKGSIFLDEIGDMSLHLQAKLLRVLQEKELNKLGGKSHIYVDVRIIAATNKDLEKMVAEGTFREDLFYRLNVIPIKLPSLRERKEDIPQIIDYMIKEYSKKLEKEVVGIEERVVDTMINYRWPGNIRELQNIIEYSVNMSSTPIITTDIIPQKVKNLHVTPGEEDENIVKLDELERREIIKALNKYKDYKKDKDLAAKSLGISRSTLYRKLEKYEIIPN